jgi:hypothetical protein
LPSPHLHWFGVHLSHHVRKNKTTQFLAQKL